MKATDRSPSLVLCPIITSEDSLPGSQDLVWIEVTLRVYEGAPQRLIVFLPVVFCHRDGVEGITLAAERCCLLEECAVGSDQLSGTLRRGRYGVA